MFRPIESSSGQLLNHVWGTSNEVHTNVIIITLISNSFVFTFSHCCKYFGIPKMCTFTWCTSNMVQQLVWCWLLESKHVTILIDNKLIQINYQLVATVSPAFYLTFMYSSTCFGRPHVHHQELNNCSSSLWFCRWSKVVAVLLVVVGPALLPPRSNGKTRGCYCSCWASNDGREDARNMLSCK
jgi:hypothetical protein